MAVIGPSRENLDRIKFLRETIEKALAPYRENTEAALGIAALMQVARAALDQYPPATRAELVAGVVAFLEGRDLDAEHEAELRRAGGIIIPKGIM